MSIQDRISALNLGHVRSPADVRNPPAKPTNKPALPPRLPPRSATTQDVHICVEDGQQSIGNQPARAEQAPEPPVRKEKSRLPLPPPRPVTHEAPSRRPSAGPPPLPSRGSQALVRRDSNESISSTVSGHSSVSGLSTSGLSTRTSVTTPSSVEPRKSTFRVPDYDPSSLPALPPKKSEQQDAQRPALRSSASAANVATRTLQKPSIGIPPVPPPRRDIPPVPPPRPRRESSQTSQSSAQNETSSTSSRPLPLSRQASPRSVSIGSSTPKTRSVLSLGMNKEEAPPAIPSSRPDPNAAPPPVPTASRPNLAALQASKPKPPFTGSSNTTPAPEGVCMKCRDFSGPDTHAAKFPREAIPPDVHWLAQSLANPFPSHTDKARALFTWCHHNIAYNAADFFNKTVKSSTPQSTLQTGLAVCEGYAALFNAMALAIGLESVVLSGGSMGYGKKITGPNDPIPPEDPNGHAWNVVKIDNGEWKLIDVCWGAGHINDNKQYEKKFHPAYFTMTNNEFGLKHYPKEQSQQFREDGTVMSWETFCRGGPDGGIQRVLVYCTTQEKHGLDDQSFQPAQKHIKIRGVPGTQRMQFKFSSVCEHWDHMKMGTGPPYQFILSVGGRDGRERKNVPFKGNGRHWWLDIEIRELGCMGQTVSVNAITTINGKDARGCSLYDYEHAVGKRSMSWSGVAAWQLV